VLQERNNHPRVENQLQVPKIDILKFDCLGKIRPWAWIHTSDFYFKMNPSLEKVLFTSRHVEGSTYDLWHHHGLDVQDSLKDEFLNWYGLPSLFFCVLLENE